MSATLQMGIFQHPAKTKAWHSIYDARLSNSPPPISPMVDHFLNQELFASARITLAFVPFFKKKMYSI